MKDQEEDMPPKAKQGNLERNFGMRWKYRGESSVAVGVHML